MARERVDGALSVTETLRMRLGTAGGRCGILCLGLASLGGVLAACCLSSGSDSGIRPRDDGGDAGLDGGFIDAGTEDGGLPDGGDVADGGCPPQDLCHDKCL